MVESKSEKPDVNKENVDPSKEMEIDEEEDVPTKVFTIESKWMGGISSSWFS